MKSFLLEGEAVFESRPLREKMTQVAYRGKKSFQEWYYDCGLNEKLPNTRSEFAKLVVDFCTGKSIASLHKYKDKKYSDYTKRVKNWAEVRS